jgi:hypothetical protein
MATDLKEQGTGKAKVGEQAGSFGPVTRKRFISI